jgi:CRP/FNR family cyclic AMP-dependent transcriptional regulator
VGSKKAIDCKELFRSGRWFASLPEAFQEALLRLGRHRELADGERLFSRGDACKGLYGVVDGAIRVSGTSARGKEALLVVLESPNWFGEVAVFDGMARTHDASADGPTKIVEVPLAALHKLLDAEPAYWRDLGRLVAGKLRLAFTTMEDTALLPISMRVARRLSWMAEGYGQWKGRSQRSIEVSQDELAQMLGSSRQTINQNLKNLESQGFIRTTYGQIEILDLPGLRGVAGME